MRRTRPDPRAVERWRRAGLPAGEVATAAVRARRDHTFSATGRSSRPMAEVGTAGDAAAQGASQRQRADRVASCRSARAIPACASCAEHGMRSTILDGAAVALRAGEDLVIRARAWWRPRSDRPGDRRRGRHPQRARTLRSTTGLFLASVLGGAQRPISARHAAAAAGGRESCCRSIEGRRKRWSLAELRQSPGQGRGRDPEQSSFLNAEDQTRSTARRSA